MCMDVCTGVQTAAQIDGEIPMVVPQKFGKYWCKTEPMGLFSVKVIYLQFFLVKVKLIQKMYSTIQVSRPVFGTPLTCTFLRTALVLQYFLCIVPSMEFVVLSIDWGAHALVLFLGTVFCIGLMS